MYSNALSLNNFTKKIKLLILSSFFLTGLFCLGQTPYEKGMQKAFDLWKSNDVDAASNLFERIASVETENWLPEYYIAKINIIKSFNQTDEKIITAQLAKAQEHLNNANMYSQNNPELIVLQAQLYTAWVAFDGQLYGMKYAQKITQLYNQAYKIEPGNPRVAFGKVEWELGTAKFFNQDTSKFCEQLNHALKLYDSYEQKGQFHPMGGKNYASKMTKYHCSN